MCRCIACRGRYSTYVCVFELYVLGCCYSLVIASDRGMDKKVKGSLWGWEDCAD